MSESKIIERFMSGFSIMVPYTNTPLQTIEIFKDFIGQFIEAPLFLQQLQEVLKLIKEFDTLVSVGFPQASIRIFNEDANVKIKRIIDGIYEECEESNDEGLELNRMIRAMNMFAVYYKEFILSYRLSQM